ncbi:unnamed protein product [Trifolium pratense]|uniref:Uncharacterized protein n=1 Tax=Trifolium pratense TaxID=57577 RepID=A0ACB0JAW0_TRIPR|nr:unnamed protein product [Trifolium pratense]
MGSGRLLSFFSKLLPSSPSFFLPFQVSSFLSKSWWITLIMCFSWLFSHFSFRCSHWAFSYWALTNHTLVHGPVHSPPSTRLQEGEVLLNEVTWQLLCLDVVLCRPFVADSYSLFACRLFLPFVVDIS